MKMFMMMKMIIGDDFWMDNSWLQLTQSSEKQRKEELNVTSDSIMRRWPTMRKLWYECLHILLIEDIMKRSMNHLKR